MRNGRFIAFVVTIFQIEKEVITLVDYNALLNIESLQYNE